MFCIQTSFCHSLCAAASILQPCTVIITLDKPWRYLSILWVKEIAFEELCAHVLIYEICLTYILLTYFLPCLLISHSGRGNPTLSWKQSPWRMTFCWRQVTVHWVSLWTLGYHSVFLLPKSTNHLLAIPHKMHDISDALSFPEFIEQCQIHHFLWCF